jgi:hypothetical protein
MVLLPETIADHRAAAQFDDPRVPTGPSGLNKAESRPEFCPVSSEIDFHAPKLRRSGGEKRLFSRERRTSTDNCWPNIVKGAWKTVLPAGGFLGLLRRVLHVGGRFVEQNSGVC